MELAVAMALWLAVVVGATVAMIRYSSTPGSSGTAPSAWPADSPIPAVSNRPILVMFAHPHCPCTRASLGELERLIAHVGGDLLTYVVFLKPVDTPVDWEKTDLWRKGCSLPGVTAYTDNAGLEAHRFHAETSGQTLLYDGAGTLLFQGGITSARGHAGDNAGRSAIEELLKRGRAKQTNTPVFGCSLFETQG